MFDITDPKSIMNFLHESSDVSGETNIDALEEGTIYEENPEFDVELAEAVFMNTLTPEELSELSENSVEMSRLVDEGLLSEKTIVKFDKKAKTERATQQAVLQIAREKKDRDFNKLIRVWKMRRALIEKLNKKYWSQAKARAKKMVNKAKTSKVPSSKKVAARAK